MLEKVVSPRRSAMAWVAQNEPAASAAAASLRRNNSSNAPSNPWTSSAMSGGRPGISRGFAPALVDEFVEQQARNHVERFKDSFAFGGHGSEGRNLHLAIVEQE